MNDKRQKLYQYLADNGMTDLSFEDFSREYSSNTDKSGKLYSYLSEQKMTDLDQDSFMTEYFGDLKKKDDPQVLEQVSQMPVEQAYQQYPNTFQTGSTSASVGSGSVSSLGHPLDKATQAPQLKTRAQREIDRTGKVIRGEISQEEAQKQMEGELQREEDLAFAKALQDTPLDDTERPYAQGSTPEDLKSRIQFLEDRDSFLNAGYDKKIIKDDDLWGLYVNGVISEDDKNIHNRRVDVEKFIENDFDWNQSATQGVNSAEDFAFTYNPETAEGDATFAVKVKEALSENGRFTVTDADIDAVRRDLRNKYVSENRDISKDQIISEIEKISEEEGVTPQEALGKLLMDKSDPYLDESSRELGQLNREIQSIQLSIAKKKENLAKADNEIDKSIIKLGIEGDEEKLNQLLRKRQDDISDDDIYFDSNYNVVDKENSNPEVTNEMRIFKNDIEEMLKSNDYNRLVERILDLDAGVNLYTDKYDNIRDERGNARMDSEAMKEYQSLVARLRSLSNTVVTQQDPSKLKSEGWWELADGFLSGLGLDDVVRTNREEVQTLITDLSELGLIRDQDIERAKGTTSEKIGFGTGLALETITEMALESAITEGIGAPAATARGLMKLRKAFGLIDDSKSFAKMSGRLYDEARMIGFHGVSPGTMIVEGVTEDLLKKVGVNKLLDNNFGKWGFAFKLPVKAGVMTIPEAVGELAIEGDMSLDALASTYITMLGLGAVSSGGIGGKNTVESELEFLKYLEENGADPKYTKWIKDNSPYSPERKEDAIDIPEGTVSEQEIQTAVEQVKQESPELKEQLDDAIQERQTEEMDVRQQARDGETVEQRKEEIIPTEEVQKQEEITTEDAKEIPEQELQGEEQISQPETQEVTESQEVQPVDGAEAVLEKETLGINIPVVVAKTAVQATRVSLEAGQNIAKAIDTGLDAVRNTDWYKGLTSEEQNEAEAQISKVYAGEDLSQISELTKKKPTKVQQEIESETITKPEGEKVVVDTWKEFKRQLKRDEKTASKAKTATKKEIAKMREPINEWLKDNSKELNKLSPKLSSAVIRKVNNAKTPLGVERAIEYIDNVMSKKEARDRAIEEQKTYEELKKLINPKTYKKTEAGATKGKGITAEGQDIIREINKVIDMDPVKASEQQAKLEEKVAEGGEMSIEDQIKHSVLDFAGLENMSLEELKSKRDLVKEAIKADRATRKSQDKEYKEQLDSNKETVYNAFGGSAKYKSSIKDRSSLKKLSDSWSGFLNYNEAWQGLVDFMNKGGKKTQTEVYKILVDPIKKARNSLKDSMVKKNSMVQSKREEIWGKDWKKAVREGKKPISINAKLPDGTPFERKLSKMQIAYLYNLYKDPSMEPTLEKMGLMGEVKDEINRIIDADPKTKEYADWIIDEFFPNEYKEVNDVYRRVNKINLPFNNRYMPIVRLDKDAADISMFSFRNNPAMAMNGSLKDRVKNTNPVDFLDIESAMMSYMANMEHFKAFAEPTRDISRVLRDKNTMNAINENNPKNTMKLINHALEDIVRGGIDSARRINWIDKLRGRLTTATLGVNIPSFIKQLTSFPAYATNTNTAQFTKELSKFAAHFLTGGNLGNMSQEYKKALEHIKETGFWKDRYSSGFDRDMAVAMKSQDFSNKPNLSSNLMIMTKLGDGGAILMGGVPYYNIEYKKAKKAGASEVEARQIAIDKFVDVTSRAQQSSEVEDLSALQRGGSLAKLFTMYKTSQRQYFSHTREALRNIARGDGTITDVKKLLMYNVTLPALFAAVDVAAWRALTGDDEEDVEEFGKDALQSMVTTNLSGLFILGDAVSSVYNQARGKDFGHNIPLLSSLSKHEKAIGKAIAGESDLTDLEESLFPLMGDMTGIPFKNIKKLTWDNYERALSDEAMVEDYLGWSPYKTDRYKSGGTGKPRRKKRKTRIRRKRNR